MNRSRTGSPPSSKFGTQAAAISQPAMKKRSMTQKQTPEKCATRSWRNSRLSSELQGELAAPVRGAAVPSAVKAAAPSRA